MSPTTTLVLTTKTFDTWPGPVEIEVSGGGVLTLTGIEHPVYGNATVAAYAHGSWLWATQQFAKEGG